MQVLRAVVKDRRCKIISWIGSDAYFATSERIEDIIEPFGLLDDDDSRDFLFASTQTSPSQDNDWGVQRLAANLSTQFMTMRNTKQSRNFLEWKKNLQFIFGTSRYVDSTKIDLGPNFRQDPLFLRPNFLILY